MHVPYSDRCWKSNSGKFFYILPFADANLSTELVELILDNNAFIESTRNTNALIGGSCIPDIRGIGVNPYPALAEQWLSNPQFWSNRDRPEESPASELISEFLTTAKRIGVQFGQGYAAQMMLDLRNDEENIRRDLGVLYGYRAAIRSLQKRKLRLNDKIELFNKLFESDIPIFNGLIGLAALTFYFQDNRTVTDENEKQVISFLDSFFSPKEKEPNEITENYLRNRAADLWAWYLIPRLYQGKSLDVIAKTGTPIVVTADKFLASVPFRYLPPTLKKTEPGALLEFRFSPDGVNKEHQQGLLNTFQAMVRATRPEISQNERSVRLGRLFESVVEMLDRQDRHGFQSAWKWAFASKS